MSEIYIIYRNNPLNKIPSQEFYLKEDAEAYANDLNEKLGKTEFFSMSLSEWYKLLNSSEIQKCMEDMDTEMEKIMKKAESNLTDIREEAYMDKSINGFRLPIIVDTNDDYERILY